MFVHYKILRLQILNLYFKSKHIQKQKYCFHGKTSLIIVSDFRSPKYALAQATVGVTNLTMIMYL